MRIRRHPIVRRIDRHDVGIDLFDNGCTPGVYTYVFKFLIHIWKFDIAALQRRPTVRQVRLVIGGEAIDGGK